MLTSLALIFLIGMCLGWIFRRLKLPSLLGMLLTGILLGPHVLNLLDGTILGISADLRQLALIVILLRAGLSLDLQDLKRVGRPALLLCFLPATMEILAFFLFGPALLHVSRLEAGLLGAVMGAVSPAVTVPAMARLMDEGWGTDKGIPQMIIAGASADDVYVIVLFTALLSLAGGESAAADFLKIPSSILLGVLLGVGAGLGLTRLFQAFHMRDSVKVLILLSLAFLFVALEHALSGPVAVSGLLAVMAMGVTLYSRYQALAKRLSVKFSKLWVAAEPVLFVLVGASVDVRYAAGTGAALLMMLLAGLAFRLFGTWLCVCKTPLTSKERLFCLLAEIPKATVQAAIGGVPLAMGLSCGQLILTAAVAAILITAPLGALAIDVSKTRLLTRSSAR